MIHLLRNLEIENFYLVFLTRVLIHGEVSLIDASYSRFQHDQLTLVISLQIAKCSSIKAYD